MKTITRCLPMLIAGLMLAACDTIKTSDEDIDRVEIAEVRKLLDNEKEKAVLLDVRPQKQFEAEHLPEAIHIALPDLVSHDDRLAHAKHIIVYGSDYRDPLSPAAAKKLIVLGYKNVHDFRGGVEAWKGAGGQTVVAGPTQP